MAGFISGFGRAQVVGDSVVFVTRGGVDVSGIFSGRGGPLSKVASPGSTISGANLQVFHDGFVRDTGAGQIAIAAGASRADAVQLTDGTTLTTLLASGTVMPNSGGKIANVIGEPHFAQGELAVIAWNGLENGGGVSFRGVYRVKNGALETVADTATALPGGFGVPDGFSSQVGFDGQTIAFWASRGPFAETDGMFVQTGDRTLTKIAQNGDAFPGGGVIDGFISPPFVSDGVVYFFAFDSSSKTRLLKYEAGTLTTLAQDGDAAPDGGQLQNLGQFGLAVEGGKVFFPALTAKGAGLYVIDGGSLQTIIPSGSNVGGIVPTAIVLQDVANDTIAIESANFSNRRLVANLAAPAIPVIVSELTNRTAAAGARVEFKVEVIGDAPLSYQWTFNNIRIPEATGNTLVLESVDVYDMGGYRVTVTNAFGSTFSATGGLNVEVPPVILNGPTNTVVEVGDQLLLRVDALGGQPLSYFWRRDGGEVVNNSPIQGFFVRTVAAAEDAGRYSVVISNAFGMITSAEVVVTVTPPAPNPVFAGGRFVPVLDDKTTVPGTDIQFDTMSLNETVARWSGSRVVFTGQTASGEPLGVFAWENNSLVRLLAPEVALPNGLGNADGFTLVNALGDEPLVFRGQQMVDGYRQPVGLYRLNGANLEMIVDTTMTAPEGNGAKFPIFYGDAVYADGKLLFSASVEGNPALYLAEGDGLRRVLDGKQDFPVVGTATTQFQGLTYNGQEFVVVAATSAQQKLVALLSDANGAVTKLFGKDETLPGSTSLVRSFGLSCTDGSTFYLTAYDSAFRVNLVSWHDGELVHLLGPEMEAGGLGTIQSIETSFPKASAGRIYSAVRVRTPQANIQGVVAAGPAGIEPVLFATKLDARRVSATYLVDVDGDRVIVLVQFADGKRALYANVGEVGTDAEPLRIEFVRPDASTLRFAVPDGAQLESTTTLDGTWQPVDATDVTISDGTRFFRLRR